MFNRIILLIYLVLVVSCSKITVLRTKELNRVRDQLDSANAVRLEYLNKRIDTLSFQIKKLQEDFNSFNDNATELLRNDRLAIRKTLDDLQRKLAYYQQLLEQNQYQLKMLSSNISVLSEKSSYKAPKDTVDTLAIQNDIKSKELFNLAYADYLNKKYKLALNEFKELIEKYPSSIYYEMSLYYAGLILYNQQNFAEAEKYFKMIIDKFKESSYAKSAYLKLSSIYINQNQKEKAILLLEELIKKFPDSPEGIKAKKILEEIKK